ncbi:ABC transporter ATP-binding protein [Leucobacter sp. OLJS4]|uniref:ATP-binding cassette domain-containing protein n=1 Tax=unclassified Leucobacter TaxID=2621730 RepID=UPI000C17BA78|nr:MULTISPECIES: ATP-binding cassette domain-containing protein [unclassified Leucobacter]PIJ55789.1 ABC transporter ATP-binding protein [Leucobacter sp. OLES1]PII87434.1 ABC transporter ATP-binding protein [Leucobacter sp. OLTLW20]PII94509.1 ABC transporter ATP-binding protein [Leucobacter sp. OLAS13]PIJ00692.1 ABC transporter ATP-binding protein [Leucobacter sp. OLDS2]PIJ03326.1 ABC transporter ATP-binding protein [Leucobacter sp. OLIS6]
MSVEDASTETLIRVSDLRKVFPAPRGTKGEDVVAVDGVSFELDADECLAIVGESGSGKTTVARMIVGLETVTDGTVEVLGQDRTAAPRSLKDRRVRAREVQYVFQDPYSSLNGRQRIGEVIMSNLKLHSGSSAGLKARAQQILDSVGLPQRFFDRYPRELSGGQRQRVAIARALAADPKVIVLDEAVAALDVSIQAQILNLLADIKAERKVSYLFISHDLAVVNQISDRMIVMENGRIVDAGDTAELLANPTHPYTRALRAAVPGPGWKPVRREQLAS